jgi:amine acid ABC transporter, permease protein, 3-TM region, His/Glu/Gln/Arg/opine family
MSLTYILDHLPMFAEAAVLTIALAIAGIVLAIIIGLVCALIRYFQVPAVSQLVSCYIELSRNTPLMIQLFFLYYGLTRVGIMLDGITCAIAGLAFLGGGYMAEAIRSGLEAVGKVQIESGLSVGLSKSQLIRYVVLPQAFAVAVPAIAANTIFLIKETSVFSIIALPDLMYVAKDLMKEGYSNESNFMLVMFYLVIILPVSLSFTYLERRMRRVGLSN